MPEFDPYSGWLSYDNVGQTYDQASDSGSAYSNDWDRFGYAGDIWNEAQQYGYEGAMPSGETGDSTNQQFGDPKADLEDWMRQSGYTNKLNPIFNGGQQNAWFNPQGKMIPGSYKEWSGEDPMFGLGMSLMGAAGGQFAGGLMGLGSFGSGALAGAMSAGAQDADLGSMARGALRGGAASYTPNVAGMAGMDSKSTLGQIVNSAAKGGVQSAIGGGNIGRGAITGGVMGGLNSLGSNNNMDGGYSRAPWETTSPSFNDAAGMSGNDVYGSSSAPWSAPTMNYPADTMDRTQAPQQDFWNSNPLGKFMSETWQNPKRLGDLAQGAMGLYSGYRRQRMAKEMMNRMGGNRDSYLANLRNELRARDAASGRRSNYAGRETQLQAKLAELDARNAPAMASLADTRFGGLESMMASGLRLGNKLDWFGAASGSPADSYSSGGYSGGLRMPEMPQTQPNSFDYSLDPSRRYRLGGR